LSSGVVLLFPCCVVLGGEFVFDVVVQVRAEDGLQFGGGSLVLGWGWG
jgi:hypothetical protein